MKNRFKTIAAAVLVSAHAAPAMSHHGASEFDTEVLKDYAGVVKEFRWVNPHISLILETQTESGEPITLEIEGNAPTTLRTVGVTATSLVPGERVTATVSPSRRFPESSAIGREVLKGNGDVIRFRVAEARGTGQQSARSASSIFGTWASAPTSVRQLGQGSRSWPLTALGQESSDNYSPTMSPAAQCIPTSAPWLMAYSAATTFELADDRVLFKSDWMGAERTIFLDGRSHPPIDEAFQQGHSVGWWEDDTLVVETTNFTNIIYGGIANGSGKRLTERFELSEDGRSMSYSFVMQDPEYIVGEVSGGHEYLYRPDLGFENLECDVETAQRFFREFR
jgi:hypothetical protein